MQLIILLFRWKIERFSLRSSNLFPYFILFSHEKKFNVKQSACYVKKKNVKGLFQILKKDNQFLALSID